MQEPTREEVLEIQQALENADFKAAENRARALVQKVGLKSRNSSSAVHFLARALYSNEKFLEAQIQTDLAVEIRKAQRKPIDSEAIMLEVLQTQLFEASGAIGDAIEQAEKVISQCVEHDMLDFIHIPVMTLSLIFARQRDINSLSTLLKTYLPVMQQQQSTPHRDELRRLWQVLNQQQNQLPNVAEINRLILNNDVGDILNQKTRTASFSEMPEKWGQDQISSFLQFAQNNTIAAFANNGRQFHTLRAIEARLQVTLTKAYEIVVHAGLRRKPERFLLEDIQPEDWLELYFLMRAHGAFLGAIRLASSGQYAETNMVLRGSLENAMYCFRVADDKSLKQVWFDKYKDGKQGSAAKRTVDKFSIKNIGLRMAEVSENISANCASLYDELIDLGAHPNERTFTALANVDFTADAATLSVITLHPDYLTLLLNNCIDIGLLMLEIFSLAMPSCTAAPPNHKIPEGTIADFAYARWCARGEQHGHDRTDWLRAEAELRCLLVQPKISPSQ